MSMLATVSPAYTGLEIFWFLVIAVLWTGYFVLEGFDFGVGMLLPVVGKDDLDRRVMVNTIGPVWDGNEVWLLVAGGATFAAFPDWYATLFSGFYLPLFLILAALIFRGVAFEFRSKRVMPQWRLAWDHAIFWGSLIPSLLWGVAFANILRGTPIGPQGTYLGSFFNLLNVYSLLGGVTTLLLFALHGSVFLTLKTTDGIQERAERTAKVLAPAATVALVGFLTWTYVNARHGHDVGIVPPFVPILAIAAVAAVGWLLRERLQGWAFVANAVALVGLVATIFLNLYPRVMVSSISSAFDLTIGNSASAPYTLKVMTVVALIFTPLVLVYQGWSYWVFRARIRRPGDPAVAVATGADPDGGPDGGPSPATAVASGPPGDRPTRGRPVLSDAATDLVAAGRPPAHQPGPCHTELPGRRRSRRAPGYGRPGGPGRPARCGGRRGPRAPCRGDPDDAPTGGAGLRLRRAGGRRVGRRGRRPPHLGPGDLDLAAPAPDPRRRPRSDVAGRRADRRTGRLGHPGCRRPRRLLRPLPAHGGPGRPDPRGPPRLRRRVGLVLRGDPVRHGRRHPALHGAARPRGHPQRRPAVGPPLGAGRHLLRSPPGSPHPAGLRSDRRRPPHPGAGRRRTPHRDDGHPAGGVPVVARARDAGLGGHRAGGAVPRATAPERHPPPRHRAGHPGPGTRGLPPAAPDRCRVPRECRGTRGGGADPRHPRRGRRRHRGRPHRTRPAAA